MSFSTEQSLRPELGRDERLLWSGMPQQGLRFRSSDWLAVPFSLMWGGFAIFWEYSVSTARNAPVFMVLWGIPFVLVGLHIIVGRFFADAYQRSRTFYGVTDQRVIIIDGLFNRQVKSLPLPTLSDISLSERSNGSGTITFGPSATPYGVFGRTWPGMGRRMAPAFDPIDDARRVYTLIRDAQHSARRPVTA
jgi:hypothetical protein